MGGCSYQAPRRSFMSAVAELRPRPERRRTSASVSSWASGSSGAKACLRRCAYLAAGVLGRSSPARSCPWLGWPLVVGPVCSGKEVFHILDVFVPESIALTPGVSGAARCSWITLGMSLAYSSSAWFCVEACERCATHALGRGTPRAPSLLAARGSALPLP